MKIPEPFTNDSDLKMCYEKKVTLDKNIFFSGNLDIQVRLIHMLLQCMKKSSELNKHEFPFYQLRVRPTTENEYPYGICFELIWENRAESQEKENTCTN